MNTEEKQNNTEVDVPCETIKNNDSHVKESEDSASNESPKKKTSVARSAAVMGIATFLSRIAGLVREQTFAYLFGAGKWTDAFNVAFKIPNLLRDLFAEGAMSAAFVPTFNSILQKEGEEKAFRLTNLTFCAILIVVGSLTTLGMVLSPYIVQILAPQFIEDPEKFAVTVTMTRIMFPFLLVISWAAISMGMLNSLGEFFIPSVAPVFLNLSMILSGWLICPLAVKFNMPAITGMAIGAMLGGILQFTVQLPSLVRKGWKFFWCLDFKDPGIRKIGKLMIPGTVGLAATQINVAVNTILATSQGDGAVSWISYAFRIMQLPIGIFGVAVAQATLPVISRQAASGDKDSMAGTLASSIRLSSFINLWACFACVALAEPVIRIIYQHGRFGIADTLATTAVLRAYSIGLVFYALIKILGPAFYALEDTKVPVKASIISIIVSITLSLALIKPFGYISLPFSSSIAAIVNAGFLFFMLQKRVGGFGKYSLVSGLIKILIATAISGVATYYSYVGFAGYMGSWFPAYVAGTFINSVVSLCVGGFAGLVALYVVSRLIHVEEADKAAELVLKKIRRKKTNN
jgi:putative peptidoglycan lipid II flippase